MACVEDLAQFVVQASHEELSEAAREQLRIRVLDALGCAIGALDGEPVQVLRRHVAEFGGDGPATLIGGGHAAPDRAALYNGALVRYLDFNDYYVARAETCNPSDSLAAILAAGEYAGSSGRDALTALAITYQVQCRLCDVAPVRAAGFDHTTQGSYAVAAGVSRTLRLDRAHTANALAISGAALNGLRVSRTGRLSQWKSLAGPHMASCATNMALLARGGITGPLEVFEGEKGFMDAIAGVFEIHWAGEDLERVRRTSIKKHDAEAHAQTAVEAALELRRRHRFEPGDIEAIDVDVFEVAWNIAGGGEEGDRTTAVATREQATDSLPYVVAVALIDGRVLPEQYAEERIARQDVQQLLGRVRVRPNPALSDAFPNEMPCRVRISLGDGRVLTKEAREYTGFYTQPMTWEMVMRKFELLAEPYTTRDLRRAIGDAVANIEEIRVADLMRLLGNVRAPETLGAARGESE